MTARPAVSDRTTWDHERGDLLRVVVRRALTNWQTWVDEVSDGCDQPSELEAAPVAPSGSIRQRGGSIHQSRHEQRAELLERAIARPGAGAGPGVSNCSTHQHEPYD